MRVLLVSSRYPLPAWRGNQVRSVEWIAALDEHEVMLLCPEEGSRGGQNIGVQTTLYRSRPLARVAGVAGAALRGRPLQEGLYSTGSARRALRSVLEGWRPDVVVVQMVRCGWASALLRSEGARVPIVYDAIDSMGLHFQRAAEDSVWPLATLYRSEAARCRRREVLLAGDAQTAVAVSERDLEWLETESERGAVVPVAGKVVTPRAEPVHDPIVVLTGNLGYRPTVQSALWFAESVWPAVRAKVPEARWLLAGARPAGEILRLARQPGIEVHPDVPDLSAFLGRARIAIAPMKSGSGVPMKVLEAMAAAIPVVVHPWAADGLISGGGDGVLVAEGVDTWSDAVARLLTDDDLSTSLGERGHAVWRQHYHPDRVAEQIREVVGNAVTSFRFLSL